MKTEKRKRYDLANFRILNHLREDGCIIESVKWGKRWVNEVWDQYVTVINTEYTGPSGARYRLTIEPLNKKANEIFTIRTDEEGRGVLVETKKTCEGKQD